MHRWNINGRYQSQSMWGTVAERIECSVCSVEIIGLSPCSGEHCVRTLSKCFTHSCYTPSMFCHNYVCVCTSELCKEGNIKYSLYYIAQLPKSEHVTEGCMIKGMRHKTTNQRYIKDREKEKKQMQTVQRQQTYVNVLSSNLLT